MGSIAAPISDKQEIFALHYATHFNKKEAAIAAGAAPEHASTYGYDWYKHPNVRARIVEIIQQRRKEYDVTISRLEMEVSRIAFADITEIIDTLRSGKNKIEFKALKDIPKPLRAAIKTFKNTKYGIEVQFHDKIGALEMLARHLGYFEADNKQKAPSGAVIYLPDNGRGNQNAVPLAGQGAVNN